MTSNRSLATLSVADSTFHCYISTSRSLASISQFQSDLKAKHPLAAHIPYAASIEDYSNVGEGSEDVTWDDDEPEPAMVGKELLRVLNLYKRGLRRQKTMKVHGNCISEGSFDGEFQRRDTGSKENGPPVATCVIVVRYFHKRLLGVTCGRLTALYGRVARLALHRHLNGMGVPYIEKYSFGGSHCRNVYGLGAGDTELILDVVPLIEYEDGDQTTENNSSFVKKLLSELKFEGMVGSKEEMLPRLQNLQADLPLVDGSSVIPIYRYPGNYSGTEWRTHPWSPTTLYIKNCVEMALKPLYHQHMNHAVSNYYRHGDDRIDHHSDKDLDLNRDGVIVSVSLGCMRVMELRDRKFPHDISRIQLPPGRYEIDSHCYFRYL
jgi:putative IMPACT (imprinted ancient) family translation regulator